MTITQIIDLILSIISGLIAFSAIVTAIIKWVKNGNYKKVLELFTMARQYVQEAETMFGSKNGVNKFNWVMTQLKYYALKTKTKITEKQIENEINAIVETTNAVNVDKFPFSKETTSQSEIDTNSENNKIHQDDSETNEIGENRNGLIL